ncbi:hypothetical protein IJG28_02480 [Candidatus Saccharibacteria bacterium]|nr:hypothetical protein [Candidatus Saccharibacteria bacterium]
MFNLIRRHKIASVVIAIDIIAILVVALVVVLHQSKTATIDILIAPSAAEVRLNGKKYDNFSSHNVMPGDYHAVVEMEGMETKEFDFSVQDGEFHRVWDYLLDNEGGFSYYLTHTEEVATLKQVANDDEAKVFLVKYDKLNSINTVLPLTYSNTYDADATEIVSISINWGEEENCSAQNFCLVVSDYTGKNHEKALSMIKEAGYDPDDFVIKYREGID